MGFKEWAMDLGIRVVKTAAQTAIGAIGATALITDVDWAIVGSSVALSVVMCILMNLANIKGGKGGDAE